MPKTTYIYPVPEHIAPLLNFGQQCIDLGVLVGKGMHPSVKQIRDRYRISSSSAYRRLAMLRVTISAPAKAPKSTKLITPRPLRAAY